MGVLEIIKLIILSKNCKIHEVRIVDVKYIIIIHVFIIKIWYIAVSDQFMKVIILLQQLHSFRLLNCFCSNINKIVYLKI